MISNSEVGLGAVSIQPLVYRLVCTNGMVVNDMGERRHHVGRQAKAVEDSFALYSDETMEAEDKAFLLKLRDTTMAAIDEARFSQVVGRLQESMAVPITGKVQDVVQLTAQSYGINAEEQEGILKYLMKAVTFLCTVCPMRPVRRTLFPMTVPPHWKASVGRSPRWSRSSGNRSISEVTVWKMSFTGSQNTKRKALQTGKSATATRTRLPMKPSAMWFGKSVGRSTAQGNARKRSTVKRNAHASVYGGQRRRSRMRENEVEKQFVEAVRAAGGQALKFTSQSMNGVPDRLVLLLGGKCALWK